MQRIPEPELMDEEKQALAYAQADFEEPNNQFVETFLNLFGQPSGTMLDLGCGPADIPLRFARQATELHIIAVDGAPAMIKLANHTLSQDADAKARIETVCASIQELRLPPQSCDAVISNSLLHHLHEPLAFWDTIRHCGRTGAAVLVMDLSRPQGRAEAQDIVDTYAVDEPAVLRKDFFNSLLAAFTPEEVEQQLTATGLCELRVKQSSDRHWIAYGILQ
ncbi:class I SAM-dependent methyltransferase [Halorhodospira halochloris]|uniref:class I SAM-dependent methyltransferase n=1 Tax=Halorhodospira halochloris TaxID=1052 RepID=UPI001EE91E6F|nr:class I SAM-dependent methyltransferase [Halorhodospira halochloris]MCG5530914.1 class I SAM-dependent methyltransferase [Halorhodospira halochloris]